MRRRTSRVTVAATAVTAVGVAAAAATGFGLGGDDGPAKASGGLPQATAKVTKQTLVDKQEETGELGYGSETTVKGRLDGTVTGLPATGSVIKRGQKLYRLDNQPVILMYGSLPAYRALSSGMEGADVTQFEKNLWALGYRGFTVDDEYTSATASAVEEWQDDLGLSETGTVDLGRVVFADGAVRVNAHKVVKGDAVQRGTPLFTITEQKRVVTVSLETSDSRLARKGATVSVELPNGKTVEGKISKTETVVEEAENERDDPETKLEVTITLKDAKALKGLDQASVDVGFKAAERKNVLTVPVGALLALSEGGYGVQAVDGSVSKIVPVETGLFSSGRVEVSGTGLSEGMTVGVPK